MATYIFSQQTRTSGQARPWLFAAEDAGGAGAPLDLLLRGRFWRLGRGVLAWGARLLGSPLLTFPIKL